MLDILNLKPPSIVKFVRLSTQEEYVVSGKGRDIWVSFKNPMRFLNESEEEISKSKKYFIKSVYFDNEQYQIGDYVELKNSEKKQIFSFTYNNIIKISGIEWYDLKKYSNFEKNKENLNFDILNIKEGASFLSKDFSGVFRQCTLLKKSKMNFLYVHVFPSTIRNNNSSEDYSYCMWFSPDSFKKSYEIVDLL